MTACYKNEYLCTFLFVTATAVLFGKNGMRHAGTHYMAVKLQGAAEQLFSYT
jgi:hypothetical protein